MYNPLQPLNTIYNKCNWVPLKIPYIFVGILPRPNLPALTILHTSSKKSNPKIAAMVSTGKTVPKTSFAHANRNKMIDARIHHLQHLDGSLANTDLEMTEHLKKTSPTSTEVRK